MNCFDAAAFALPAQFTFGNADRNILRGPKYVNTDLSLMKNVPLGGSATFQIRVEMFNLFNTVNWGNPNAVVRVDELRPDHVSRHDAAGAAGGEGVVLSMGLRISRMLNLERLGQHFLLPAGPHPRGLAWGPTPTPASARFARAAVYSQRAAWTGNLSDHRMLIQAVKGYKHRCRAKRGTGSAWGCPPPLVEKSSDQLRRGLAVARRHAVRAEAEGPTRAGGGGVPARNQEMQTERH